MQRLGLAMFGMLVVLMFGTAAHADEANFQEWLVGFKHKAKAAGVSPQVVDSAFEGISENEEVIKLDRKQPEKKISLRRYLNNTISERRIEKGRQMMGEYREILEQIGRKYGVQPKYIVALWAIETDYGSNTGGFSLVESLATLAYEGRRADFFSKELISALKIMEAEGLSADELTGSWAGAMGQCQFMPSTYLRYAADGNGDGKRDIWNNTPDVFASIANYLDALGWNDSLEWGYAVSVPADFKRGEANIKHSKPSSHWRARGLMVDGNPVGNDTTPLYAIYPDANAEDVLLVTENFQAILNWNRSRYFATAVGTLADQFGE
jgi:membrane-bound lytic murein transglycosylase B